MRIVVGGIGYEVRTGVPGAATVADLIASLPPGATTEPGSGLVIDGRPVNPAAPLDTVLIEGVRIDPSGRYPVPAPGDDPTGTTLVVVAGPDAGRRLTNRGPQWELGRADLGSSTVSRRHCRVTVDPDGAVSLTDLTSTNGTRIDGQWVHRSVPLGPDAIAWLGATALRVATSGGTDRPHRLLADLGRQPNGRIAFNRPPRPAPTPSPLPPAPPTIGRAPRAPGRPPVARLLLPLTAGAVLALVHDPRLALLATIGPLGVGISWWSARRQARREHRLTVSELRNALARFRADAAAAHHEACRRRRARYPDLAETVRRATAPSVRLWERRPAHDDHLHLVVGPSDVAWDPGLPDDAVPEAAEAVAGLGPLRDVPVTVDAHGVIGLVGPRHVTVPLARALVAQAAVHHGPADLAIALCTDDRAAAAWEWATWLPHTRDPATDGRRRLMAVGTDATADLLGDALTGEGGGDDRSPRLLLVVDGESLLHGRRRPARDVLAGRGVPATGVVLAAGADRLPSSCTWVVEALDDDGTVRVVQPRRPGSEQVATTAGLGPETALDVALALARFDDPEAPLADAGVPEHVALCDVLDLEHPTAATVAARWTTSDAATGLAVPVGADQHGVVAVDLVADGPHALVGGTTGAGKSELLRSWVAALGASVPPTDCTLLLVDYKGGSAFDRCAALPHVVGVVTDLDGPLAERVLVSLEAELRRRERSLRRTGVDDIAAYLRRRGEDPGLEPLPRLVLVIDELAALVAELPGFVDGLVDLAQRGRSLGIHLVLATQRPAGVVKDAIRTNTNLRIALRMLDDADSRDVLGRPDAAAISRHLPGRALIRRGPADVMSVQTALVTGRTARDGRRAPVTLVPLERGAPRPEAPTVGRSGAPSDLDRLVDAVTEAWTATGSPPPRRPWLDPLPHRLSLDELGSAADAPVGLDGGSEPDRVDAPVVLGRADLPRAQAQPPVAWWPATGPLVVFGGTGAGTTAALRTIAHALARDRSPSAVHLYVLDAGRGELADLAELPHTGAVVAPGEVERRRRLLAFLEAELHERRSRRGAGRPAIVCLVDNLVGLFDELERARHLDAIDLLRRLLAEGSGVGLHLAVTADRPGALPTALHALTPNRLALRLADAADYLGLGLGRIDSTGLPPGRGVVAGSGLSLQLAWVAPGTPAPPTGPPTRPPRPIGTLPADVSLRGCGVDLVTDPDTGWWLPLGIADTTLEPVGLPLGPGAHVLVAGPPRSGRSSLLAAIVELAIADPGDLRVAAVAPRPSPLADVAPDLVVPVDVLASAVTGWIDGRPTLVLVDDADLVDVAGAELHRIVTEVGAPVHVVAVARPDRLRSSHGHWTGEIRRGRVGVLLGPDEHDGDLLGVRLPARGGERRRPGLGYVVRDGRVERFQAARPHTSRGPGPPTEGDR